MQIVKYAQKRKYFDRNYWIILFLKKSLNTCCGCAKESSHREDSFECPQHLFLTKNEKLKLITWSVYLEA